MFLCAATLRAKTIHDNTFRFDISVPDSSYVCFAENNSQPYLTAYSQGCLVMIDVFPLDGEKVYAYRKTILDNALFQTKGYYYLQSKEPWYNMLRNSRIIIENPEDGLVLCHRLIYRAQTLFWVRVSCEQNLLETAKKTMDSFDPNCSTKSYYRIMRSNLHWYQGSFYLTIIPLLGYLSAKNRKKWIRSGKNDTKARRLSFVYAIVSVSLICFAMFCIKGCFPLAIIIGVVSILVWLVFFFGQRFMIYFINGFFS